MSALPRSLALLALMAVTAPGAGAQAPTDPQTLADQVMQALGGAPAWSATRYLRFDFAVERGGKEIMRRAHTWDKWSGDYRLEGRRREDQKPYRVVMNLHTKEGAAWLDGAPLAGDDLKKQLENGYAAWVNDTYWLLMPYKLKDPGVTLALDGERREGGAVWDKLLLTFDSVGLTPKDKYWAHVNRATRLVDRWEFVLKGEKGEPTAFDWKGWRAYGSIQLASERVNPKDGTRIHFPVLDVPASVPEDTFTRR
jgi:hypothetical protein